MAKRDDVKNLILYKNSAMWREALTKPSRAEYVNELFLWSSTEEGDDYWHDVYLGRVPFEEYQEKLFRLVQYSKKLKVALSDLFLIVGEEDLWE